MAARELTSTVRGRESIGDAQIGEMYSLFSRYYGGADESLFRHDLAQKQHVIELRHGDALAGFSTVAVYDFRDAASGTDITVMFSGDTIIDHRCWGTQALPAAFGRFAGEVSRARGKPLYWLLISKGYRTYRYLPLFLREFWPRPERDTPQAMRCLMDAIATHRFGGYYDRDAGLLRFPSSRGHLKPPWTEVAAGAASKPAVRFFLERNPGYTRGDELVCLAPFGAANLRGVVRRHFLAGAGSEAP